MASVGQTKEELKRLSKKYAQQDSNFIYAFPHRITINPSFFLRTYSFSLKSNQENAEVVVYKPNNLMRVGVVGIYKGYKLGLSIKTPSYLDNKSNTESFSLFFSTQTRLLNWGLDFYWLNNQGYELMRPIPEGEDTYFRHDIKTTNVGFSTHFINSNKFSLKAALNQTEKQLKSAGGIGIQVSINYSGLESDSTIIPFSQQSKFSFLNEFSSGGFLSFNLRPGYAYTYVLGDFSATFFANVGLGLQIQNYQLSGEKDWEVKLAPSLKVHQILGYNMEKGFINVSFLYESNNYVMMQTKLVNNFMLLSFGAGLRFM